MEYENTNANANENAHEPFNNDGDKEMKEEFAVTFADLLHPKKTSMSHFQLPEQGTRYLAGRITDRVARRQSKKFAEMSIKEHLGDLFKELNRSGLLYNISEAQASSISIVGYNLTFHEVNVTGQFYKIYVGPESFVDSYESVIDPISTNVRLAGLHSGLRCFVLL
jgi:hypothetical protein